MNPHLLVLSYKTNAKVVGQGWYPSCWGIGLPEGPLGAREVGSEACKDTQGWAALPQGCIRQGHAGNSGFLTPSSLIEKKKKVRDFLYLSLKGKFH